MSVFKAFFGLGKIPKVTKYFEFPSFDDVNKMGGAIQAMKTEARITGKKFSPAQKKYLDDQMKQVEIVFQQIKSPTTKSPPSGIRNTEPAKIFDLQGKEIPKGSKIMGGKEVKETEAEIAARLLKENKMSVGRLRKKKIKEEVSKVNDQIEEMMESGVDENNPELAKLYDKQNDLELDLDLENMMYPDPTDFADGGVAGLLGERPGYQDGLKVYPKIQASKSNLGLGDGKNVDLQDLTYGGSLMYDKGPFSAGIEYLKGKDKFDFKDEEDTLAKDTTDRELANLILMMKLKDGSIKFKGNKDNQMINFSKSFAEGGPARQNFAFGRRAFLKLLAGTGAGIAGLKSGFMGLGKKVAVKTAAPIIAGSGTPPPYFFKLVDKIKTLGDDSTKLAVKDREKITTYKDYTLTEDITTGEKTIQRMKIDNDLKYDASEYYGKPVGEETYMNYKPGKGQADETMKGKTPPDEYTEDTSLIRADKPAEGEVMQTVSGVPDDIFLEVGEQVPEAIRKTKADGGRIGYKFGGKGIMAGINKLFGKGTMTTADKIKRPQQALDREMFKKTEERLKNKRILNEDEISDLSDEVGDLEAYNFDGTVGSANKLRKERADYIRDMEIEYKKGNLDPVEGDKSPARKKFLEKKLEEMEMSGDQKLMTADEIEELSFFDLGSEMDVAKVLAPKSVERMQLKNKYPGITDDLLDKILIDDNMQRKAEVLATIDEAFKMMEKGKGSDEIIETFKNVTRTKQASGGRIGFSGGGGLFNLLKLLFKPTPKKLETVKNFVDRRQFLKNMVGNTEKNRKARQLAESKENIANYMKQYRGYKFPSDKQIKIDLEKKIQPILNKYRKLNADGGLANMLGE